MKWINLLLLVSTLSLYSCKDNAKKTRTTRDNQITSNDSAIHPNQLFQDNCAMCHGYNNDLTAPAIVSYSVDSILNYYDGKSRRDSVWQQHKNIQLTRNDWERIAIQMQPGDVANSNTPSISNGSNLKTDDYIKQYPANQNAELRQHIESLKKEWQNTPNPITATYQGNDFGDYHHVLFKDAKGVNYDFGQANNNYGPFNLHALSGQFEDNPEFLGKEFKVYWEWKLSDFFCCDGEYGKAKAYLPSITKLELIKRK